MLATKENSGKRIRFARLVKYAVLLQLVVVGPSLYLLKGPVNNKSEERELQEETSPSQASQSQESTSCANRDWIRNMFENPCKKLGFSQGNQDCMLDKIFDHLGTENKYYVEYGFNTNKQCDASGPNTCKLWKNGWKGLLLDGSHENPKINLQKHFLYRENIVDIFEENNVPIEMDFLSSDMDSHDFFILEAILEKYKPRVVTTEYNKNWEAGWEISQIDPTLDPELKRQSMNNHVFRQCVFGASASAVRLLMEKHGYVLIGISNPTFLDLFWARRELVECYDIPTFDEIMANSKLGTIFHVRQRNMNFLDWLADVRVWQETGDIEKARASAKDKLVAGAKAGTLGPCFRNVQKQLLADNAASTS